MVIIFILFYEVFIKFRKSKQTKDLKRSIIKSIDFINVKKKYHSSLRSQIPRRSKEVNRVERIIVKKMKDKNTKLNIL